MGCPGSIQLVIQEVSIHAHHTASSRTALQRAGRQVFEQAVRKLRHREHEHEIEEQFDVGDARVPAASLSQMVLARGEHRCCHSG